MVFWCKNIPSASEIFYSKTPVPHEWYRRHPRNPSKYELEVHLGTERGRRKTIEHFQHFSRAAHRVWCNIRKNNPYDVSHRLVWRCTSFGTLSLSEIQGAETFISTRCILFLLSMCRNQNGHEIVRFAFVQYEAFSNHSFF